MVDYIPITGISVITAALPSQLNLHTLALVNATLQLTATAIPLNATDTNLFWASSNSNVVNVSDNGLVTAVGRGIAYINVKTYNGGYVAPPYSINVDIPTTTTGIINDVTVNTTAVTNTDATTIRDAISSTTLSAANSIAQIRTELTQGGVADTQIAKSAIVTSGVNTFQAAVADITAINTMYNSGTSVKLASTTNSAIDTFIPSTPDVTSVGIVLTETSVSTTNPTVAAVTIAVAKLDANDNRIVSTLTDPTTFDTVVVTLPKAAYLKITHLGGSYEATNQVYTDVNNTTIGAIDLTNVYPGKLYTFTSTAVPYVNNIKMLVLDHTNTTVKVAYTGPFSETVFEPLTAPPANTLISNETANPSSIACFPTGTRILTAEGYKAVETIKTGDVVMTADGRSVNATVYSYKIKVATAETAPYCIPANTFANQPNELRLSPLHAIQTQRGIWQIPEFAAKKNAAITQYGLGEKVTYYHIETANYFTDNLVAEGAVVESFMGKAIKSLPSGTPVYTYNSKLSGFTRYNPNKQQIKKH